MRLPGVRTRRVEIRRMVCPRASGVERVPLRQWRNCCPHRKDELELRSRRNLRRAALSSRSRVCSALPFLDAPRLGSSGHVRRQVRGAGGGGAQGRLDPPWRVKAHGCVPAIGTEGGRRRSPVSVAVPFLKSGARQFCSRCASPEHSHRALTPCLVPLTVNSTLVDASCVGGSSSAV